MKEEDEDENQSNFEFVSLDLPEDEYVSSSMGTSKKLMRSFSSQVRQCSLFDIISSRALLVRTFNNVCNSRDFTSSTFNPHETNDLQHSKFSLLNELFENNNKNLGSRRNSNTAARKLGQRTRSLGNFAEVMQDSIDSQVSVNHSFPSSKVLISRHLEQ